MLDSQQPGVWARAVRVFRELGFRAFIGRILGRILAAVDPKPPAPLVPVDEAAVVDWTVTPPHLLVKPHVPSSGPLHLAWIVSPPGRESGGHQNIFRFIKHAEQHGHRCTVYLYDPQGAASVEATRSVVDSTNAYPDVAADIRVYDGSSGVAPDTNAIIATGWETAYPSFLDQSPARRLYFVQDFEPSFYPAGSEYVLAENTYRFGFHGITAGGWLAEKLAAEYGMSTDSFDLAVDTSHYWLSNPNARSEVFFYARPVTPRRAFGLGALALQDFAAMRPEVTINLAGWQIEPDQLPFAFVNHGSLELGQLNDLYNRCAAGLVLSLTNMSLLPLELMSSGVVPVVNDAPNNRLVADNEYIEWVPLSPATIAQRLADILDRHDAADRVRRMSASVAGVNWSDSGRAFVQAVERVVRGS